MQLKKCPFKDNHCTKEKCMAWGKTHASFTSEQQGCTIIESLKKSLSK